MKKVEIIKKEIEELKKKQIILQEQQDQIQKEIIKREKIIELLNQKTSTTQFSTQRSVPFTLSKKAPSLQTLLKYEVKDWESFPYYVGGQFEIREFAETIKQILQFEKGVDFAILMIGIITKEKEVYHKDLLHKMEREYLKPNLYFIIAKKNLLIPYAKLNGYLINSENYAYIKQNIEKAAGKDLVILSAQQTSELSEALDVECYTGYYSDKMNHINYYDYLRNKYTTCLFSKYQQMIIPGLKMKDIHHHIQNNDLLNFRVDQQDSFIGDIITSICLYKQKNGIQHLKSEDYQHIFQQLYGQKVDIKELTENNMCRRLKYVETGRKK